MPAGLCDLPGTLDDALERMLVAACEANRLARLEYRWVERFRLWERWSPELAAKGRALAERRRDAIRIAEDADWELGPLWNCWSRALPPISVPAVRLAARSLSRGLGCTLGEWRHD